MSHAYPSRRRGHRHEQHFVLVRQCPRCARWIVLRGRSEHVAGYHDESTARVGATELLRKITGHPDPDPVLVVIAGDGSTGSAPVEPAIATSD